jgi:N-acyl-D-amino-acid deacylase
MSRLLTAFAIILVSACGGSNSSQPAIVIEGAGVERIDSAMNGVMNRHAPPGISVAVARDGKLVFAKAYGFANIAGTEALTPDHMFRVASVSKPVTGIAVLRAAEQGLLGFDEKAFDVLASYLPLNGADPRIGDIEIWHLMHHTGGWNLYDYPSDPLFRSLEVAQVVNSTMPPDPQALTRWIAMQPLAFDPGSNFAYTNIGFVLLGRILEQASGLTYEDFVQQHVLQPAGITRTRLGGITKGERLPGEVEYEFFSNSIWKSVFDGTTVIPEPAYGGLNLLGFDASSAWVFSAVDLVKLAAASDGNSAYPDIISSQSFDTMIERGTPAGSSVIGVAWFLGLDSNGVTTEWNHFGGMPGTVSLLARLRSGVIVAVITNTARNQNFTDDLFNSTISAVNGITDWPDVDLFGNYP